MDSKIATYIKNQPSDRHELLTSLHQIILDNDKTVVAVVEPMMGKEMIIYKGNGVMKYGLASVKNYMSLHLLPMYGIPNIHAKYKALLAEAEFQKGCINFKDGSQVPGDIVRNLIIDCSPFDLKKLKEEYLASKKKKKA